MSMFAAFLGAFDVLSIYANSALGQISEIRYTLTRKLGVPYIAAKKGSY